MKCPIETQENAELLLSYSARRLNPESTAILEAHMELCLACQEFRDGQRALWEALDQWEARPVSADFDRRLYRRIEEQDRMGWWTRVFGSMRPMFLRPALPLAAWEAGPGLDGRRCDNHMTERDDDRLLAVRISEPGRPS